MSTMARGSAFDVAISPAMVQNIGDVLEIGVLVLDRDKRVRGWNRWLESASGRSARDVVGRELTEIYADFRDSAGDRAIDRALAGATSVLAHRFHESFLRFQPPAGETDFEVMQQSARILPNIDADGRIIGVVVLIDDVTERVARDPQLRSALRAAETANKTKSDFLASMSHELRTPLGGIAGYADLLIEGITGTLNEQQLHHATRIKNVARHLLSIVDEILSFSRLHAGREQLHLTEVDAVRIARDAANVVDPVLRAKGLEIAVDVPAAPHTMITDEVKVRQILINLLGNAAKFVDRGRVTLRVRADESDHTLSFVVADTGPGIAPENQLRVFEPFTQVDASLTRRSTGTGLGLPVSRQLARLLGGDVTLLSEPGGGCIFTVTLPKRPRELAAI